MERVVARIREALERKRISKHFLAEQLATSDAQIQRLLDPDVLKKNLDQLYRIATLVGLELEWNVRKAA
jgi:ribosome-binding protein aMBF1 (putative translation factor)